MDVTIWMGLAFLFLGLEKFVPFPPQVTGVVLLLLGLIILVPALTG